MKITRLYAKTFNIVNGGTEVLSYITVLKPPPLEFKKKKELLNKLFIKYPKLEFFVIKEVCS